MFQRNKNSYRIVAVCSNGNLTGRYTVIESEDTDWGSLASQEFYNEFGVQPTSVSLESREKL